MENATPWRGKKDERVDRQFGILLSVKNGSDWDTEVGEWAPEIYIRSAGLAIPTVECGRDMGLSLRVEQK